MRLKPLFPDQVAGVNKIVEALKAGNKRIVFKLPTGGGKTVIASEVILRAREKGNRVSFVVDAISLIDQTVERFIEAGIPSADIGVLQGYHHRTDICKPVQIISIDTLRSRPFILNLPDYSNDMKLVIVDECHCQKNFLYDWMKRWNAVTFIGLSATPYAQGMAKHWDALVSGGTLRDMIASERLSSYKVYAAARPVIRDRKGTADFTEDDMMEAMNGGALVSNAVSHWKKYGQGRPTLTFCINRTHAAHVQKEFEAGGVKTGYIDAYTEIEDRKIIGDQLASGEISNVVSVGCLTKGVDWDVRCIVLLRPTKSEMLYLQIIGRGLRVAEGKDYCLILDHSDTVIRLGPPEEVDESHTELNDGTKPEAAERKPDEAKPSPCGKCGFIKAPKQHQCPMCGFQPERQHSGPEVQVELEELIPASKIKINRDTSVEQKAAFFAGLKGYGESKGYKLGWAANQYKERFGVWPDKYRDVRAQEPDAFTHGWILRKNIAYARRKAKS